MATVNFVKKNYFVEFMAKVIFRDTSQQFMTEKIFQCSYVTNVLTVLKCSYGKPMWGDMKGFKPEKNLNLARHETNELTHTKGCKSKWLHKTPRPLHPYILICAKACNKCFNKAVSIKCHIKEAYMKKCSEWSTISHK